MSVRVLLVDANETMSKLLVSSLTRYGFEVETQIHSDAAVADHKRRAFDVVVCQANPSDSELKTVKALRKRLGQKCALVLKSSLGKKQQAELDAGAHKTGADAWLCTPLSMHELRETLARCAHQKTGASSALMPPAGASGRARLALSAAPPRSADPAFELSRLVNEMESIFTAPEAAPKEGGTQIGSSAERSKDSIVPIGKITLQRRPSSQVIMRPPVDFDFDTSPQEIDALTAGQIPISSPKSVANAMLQAARTKRTGLLRLVQGKAKAVVAFANGLLVGATDNSRDNRLGPRLERAGLISPAQSRAAFEDAQKRKVRHADALVSMGFVTADALLEQLKLQAIDRAAAAIAWRGGHIQWNDDVKHVKALAVGSFDLYYVLLCAGQKISTPLLVETWLERAQATSLEWSIDLEDALLSLGRLAPKSLLPRVLLLGCASLEDTLHQIRELGGEEKAAKSHLFALWLAGIVRLNHEGMLPTEPVPHPVFLYDPKIPRDQTAITAVRREWIRAAAAPHHVVLGLNRSAPLSEQQQALLAYRERLRPILDANGIADAGPLADELKMLVEEIAAKQAARWQQAKLERAKRKEATTQVSEFDVDVDVDFDVEVEKPVDVEVEKPVDLVTDFHSALDVDLEGTTQVNSASSSRSIADSAEQAPAIDHPAPPTETPNKTTRPAHGGAPAARTPEPEVSILLDSSRRALLADEVGPALESLRQACLLAPNDPDVIAQNAYANLLDAWQRATTALEGIEQAHQVNPRAALPLLLLGLAAEKQQRWDAAADLMTAAARRCPDDPQVRRALLGPAMRLAKEKQPH